MSFTANAGTSVGAFRRDILTGHQASDAAPSLAIAVGDGAA